MNAVAVRLRAGTVFDVPTCDPRRPSSPSPTRPRTFVSGAHDRDDQQAGAPTASSSSAGREPTTKNSPKRMDIPCPGAQDSKIAAGTAFRSNHRSAKRKTRSYWGEFSSGTKMLFSPSDGGHQFEFEGTDFFRAEDADPPRKKKSSRCALAWTTAAIHTRRSSAIVVPFTREAHSPYRKRSAAQSCGTRRVRANCARFSRGPRAITV